MALSTEKLAEIIRKMTIVYIIGLVIEGLLIIIHADVIMKEIHGEYGYIIIIGVFACIEVVLVLIFAVPNIIIDQAIARS